MKRQKLNIIVFFLFFAVSCKVLPTKPYLAKEAKIEFTADSKLSKEDKNALRSRLFNAQDDSVKVTIKQHLFVIKYPVNPIVYDTAYSKKSARNMEASLRHLGYYKAIVTDTAYFKTHSIRSNKINIFKKRQKITEVSLKYTVKTDVATTIESFNYRLKNENLQAIAVNSKEKSFVTAKVPVTKTAILSEIGRLVDSFRNNGYYKFTASELRMRGDSSIAALTNISDDPFEQLEALVEAQKKKDSPTIKLALVVVKPEDSTKLNKYTINKIYIISDFRQGDNISNTNKFYFKKSKEFRHYFHSPIFKTELLERNLTLKSGEVFRQNDFYSSINNLTKLAVWQNVNIRLIENLDSSNKLDVVIELTPAKKLTPSFTLDINYSAAGANNNGIGGNLFGTSLNFSLENKNFAKEAIKMAHNFRFGIEFRNRKISQYKNPIQSNEVSYSNDISIPRFFYPEFLDFRKLFYRLNSPKSAEKKYRTDKKETFINTNFSYSNRLDFFNLQNVGLAYGYRSKNAKNNIFTFKLLNIEFSNLYNISSNFQAQLDTIPFLKYSYNTAFVVGLATSYTSTKKYLPKVNKKEREGIFRISAEESGKTWGLLIPKNENLKKYIKLEAEYKYNNVTFNKKNSFNLRGFVGFGKPLSNNDALPFFKQFAGGGSSSMRGWPIRGIGRGGQSLAPYSAIKSFNDRTGDIQIEFNAEHRHFITKIYTDLISLRGAIFVDAGNVWNYKESFDRFGVSQNTKFDIKKFGVSAGYGFRFDLTYLVLRTDFGFRFVRPETSNINGGWKAPDVSFDDIFQKILSKDYKQWRYENFNFSFGINYPF